jgi:hypothetical protein
MFTIALGVFGLALSNLKRARQAEDIVIGTVPGNKACCTKDRL